RASRGESRPEARRSRPRFARIAERDPDREGVAVGVLEDAVAPAVRPVLCRDEDGVAPLSRATLGGVRIEAEDTDLGAKAAFPRFAQPRRPGHAVVGVVGVELDAYTIPVERREVDVGISRTEAEDPRIEGKASPDVADDEVHAEPDEGAAVRGRGHPRLARPLLGHAITVARACARRASVHAGTVTRTSATPAPRESEVPRPAR